jgi:hypothetical protein
VHSRAFVFVLIPLAILVIVTSPPLLGAVLRAQPTPTATRIAPPTATPTPTSTPDPFAAVPTATPLPLCVAACQSVAMGQARLLRAIFNKQSPPALLRVASFVLRSRTVIDLRQLLHHPPATQLHRCKEAPSTGVAPQRQPEVIGTATIPQPGLQVPQRMEGRCARGVGHEH